MMSWETCPLWLTPQSCRALYRDTLTAAEEPEFWRTVSPHTSCVTGFCFHFIILSQGLFIFVLRINIILYLYPVIIIISNGFLLHYNSAKGVGGEVGIEWYLLLCWRS